MKLRNSLLLIFFLIPFMSQAQLGNIGKVLSNGQPFDMKNKVFVDLNVTYPVGLQQVNNYTGNVVFPFTQVGIHYGVLHNITIGAQAGYFATKSSQAKDFLYTLLGIEPQTINSKFITLGVKGSSYYQLRGSENVSIPISVAAGYRFITNEVENPQAAQNILESLLNSYDKASKFYFSTTTGINYHFQNAPITLAVEVGYGYGYGNDIFAGVNNLLITGGIKYRLN